MPGFSLSTTRSNWKAAVARFERAQKTVAAKQWLSVKRAALLMEREVKLGIRRGAPGGQPLRPLSVTTLFTRSGTKPLIDKGDLIASIGIKEMKREKAVFVGVHREAKTRDGKSMANVAAIHEFGTGPFAITVTPKVRAFFMRLFIVTQGRIKPLSSSKSTIYHPGIPARPFMRPTLEKIKPLIEQTIVATLSENGGPI